MGATWDPRPINEGRREADEHQRRGVRVRGRFLKTKLREAKDREPNPKNAGLKALRLGGSVGQQKAIGSKHIRGCCRSGKASAGSFRSERVTAEKRGKVERGVPCPSYPGNGMGGRDLIRKNKKTKHLSTGELGT